MRNSIERCLEGFLKLEETYKKYIFKIEPANETVLDSSRIKESVLLETGEHSPDSQKRAEISEEVLKINRGDLIPLKCGHNGNLSQRELEIYSLHLLNCKFIE